MAYREQGPCPVKPVVYPLSMDTQDRQDERLLLRKLTGSMIECAFVGNLRCLRGPSRIPFESFPTPWNPYADSALALLTDPLAPLVEVISPFPTFGGSLLSFLQPLSGPWGPWSAFVALRGYLFSVHCLSGAGSGCQAPFNSGMLKRPSTRVTKGSSRACRSSSLISRWFSPGRTSEGSSSNSNSWLSFNMIPAKALGSG